MINLFSFSALWRCAFYVAWCCAPFCNLLLLDMKVWFEPAFKIIRSCFYSLVQHLWQCRILNI